MSLDLDNLRRKRIRLFAPSDPSEQTTFRNVPPTYSTGPVIGATASAPIDLTTTSTFTAATSDETAAASALIDLTKMDDDEKYARQLQDDEYQSAHKLPRKVTKKVEDVEPIILQEVDTSDDAKKVRAFARKVMSVKCASCGDCLLNGKKGDMHQFNSKIATLPWNSTTVNALEPIDNDYESVPMEVGLDLRCPKCKDRTCMGCGHSAESCANNFSAEGDGVKFVWHCDAARLAHIWFLLCGYDTQVKHNKLHLRQPAPKSTSLEGEHGRDSGTGYSQAEAYYEDPPSMATHTAPSMSSFKGPGYMLGGGTASKPNPNLSLIAKGLKDVATPSPMPLSFTVYGSKKSLGDDGPYSANQFTPYQDFPISYYSVHSLEPKPFQPNAYGNMEIGEEGGNKKLVSPFADNQFDYGVSSLYDGEEDDSKDIEDDHEDDGLHSHSGEGTGYDAHRLNQRLTGFSIKKRVRVDPDDDIAAKVMAGLTVLLPSTKHDVPSAFDRQPPPVLVSMLLRSSILDRVADLLGNGTLYDITQRGGLYESLLNFIDKISTHDATRTVIIFDSRVKQAGHDLLKVSTRQPTRLLSEKVTETSPLAACVYAFKVPAGILIKQADPNDDEPEAQQEFFLCHKAYNLAEDLAAYESGRETEDGKETTLASTVTQKEDVDAWHKDLSMVEVPDDVILDNSIHKSEASKIVGPPAGRMRALIKEIACLKSSLPPGIFVCYGASRLDVMKIIILGPKGTPYENGLWEFDLCCTINFPNEPPIMTFRTTGDGSRRINPNLYEDGMVCLSLLGTYDGEPWQPGRSTLLQLLVSIQAMILCEEPICNEPGQEELAGTQHSKNYNDDIHPWTVKYAMVEWLEKGHEIWGDVVKKHFDTHGKEIVETVEGWIEGRQQVGSDGSLVQKLKGALMQLG